MAKYLVTGGAGFIGSNLVDELIERGHKVAVIDDLSTGKKEYLNPKAKFYQVDICSSKIEKIFEIERPDFVFHLAAQMDVRRSVADPVFDNKINVVGSLNIFSNSYKQKVKKVVFISTGGAMYGDVSNSATEIYLPKPDCPYAIHKLAAEEHLQALNNLYDLDYVILRLANVYGPRQYKGGEGAVVAVFTYNILHNKESVIYGTGKQTRDFVYVGDVVEACMKAIEKKCSGVFNIGSNKEISVLSLIKEIEIVVGKKIQFEKLPARLGEVKRSVLDNSKAKKVLAWQPKINLEEGIKKTLEWAKNKK